MIANRDRTILVVGLIAVHFNREDHKRRHRQLIREQLEATAGATPRHHLISASPRLG